MSDVLKMPKGVSPAVPGGMVPVTLVKKSNVLGGRLPVDTKYSVILTGKAAEDPVEVWRRFRRDNPDENTMEWERA